MALQPLIPDPNNPQSLPPVSTAQMPNPVPNVGSPLKPLVSSPRLDQENQLQQKIQSFENPSQPQGFWQKLGHVASQVGNVAGNALVPHVMERIPGTQANNEIQHDQRVKELAGLQGQDRADENAASENTLRAAQTGEAQARTEGQQQKNDEPAPAPEEPSLAQGYAHAVNKAISEGRDPSTDPVVQHIADAITSLQKQPTAKEDSPTVGLQKKIVEAENQGNQADAAKYRQQLKDLNPLGEQRMQFTIAQAGEREGKADTKGDHALKTEVLKAYQPTLDSAERMNVMTESYEKAVRDHDQQAMLNLLANHLGMTMGLQKGARMNKDIIQEAQHSQPWLQGMKAKFSDDGYLSGVTLSPNQMHQMVELGQSRFAEDAKKSGATARYLGANDEGPERVPGPATIRYYTAKAQGDPAKAKALAAADGFTVK
jgi:hypothetical protein